MTAPKIRSAQVVPLVMQKPARRRCPCMHTIYVRDIGQYRDVTDPHCSACEGTSLAFFLRPGHPRNVTRTDPEVSA